MVERYARGKPGSQELMKARKKRRGNASEEDASHSIQTPWSWPNNSLGASQANQVEGQD